MAAEIRGQKKTCIGDFEDITFALIDRRAALRLTVSGLFLLVVGYLVVLPLVHLEVKAFTGGKGDDFAAAFTRHGFGRIVGYTVGLALGSLLIGLILGTLLAWASTRLPRRARFLAIFPVLPIVVPAIASVAGWTFLLAPAPGYLNALQHKALQSEILATRVASGDESSDDESRASRRSSGGGGGGGRRYRSGGGDTTRSVRDRHRFSREQPHVGKDAALRVFEGE